MVTHAVFVWGQIINQLSICLSLDYLFSKVLFSFLMHAKKGYVLCRGMPSIQLIVKYQWPQDINVNHFNPCILALKNTVKLKALRACKRHIFPCNCCFLEIRKYNYQNSVSLQNVKQCLKNPYMCCSLISLTLFLIKKIKNLCCKKGPLVPPYTQCYVPVFPKRDFTLMLFFVNLIYFYIFWFSV